MPSPRELLIRKVAEALQQSADDLLEDKLGEAERAVRDIWKRLEALSEAREQLRNTFTGTEGEQRKWQEQGEELKQEFQQEGLASMRVGSKASDLLDRVTPSRLLLKGTTFVQVEQALESRMRQYREDRQNVRAAVIPLINEEPQIALPAYSAPAQQQVTSAAQSRLGTTALETLPSGSTRAPDPSSSAAPPPYSPPSRSSPSPALPAYQGPGQRPRSR